MSNIVVIGDSIGSGHWDSQGGWVARLTGYFNALALESDYEIWHSLMNLSLPGEGVSSVFKRFEVELESIEALLSDPSLILFALGTNDTMVDMSRNKPVTDINTFGERVADLNQLCQSPRLTPVWLSLPQVDDDLVNPMPWKPGWGYQDDMIRRFNNRLGELSLAHDFDLIDVYTPLAQEDLSEVLADGVHPSDWGHEIIFETVLAYLKDSGFVE